jgi:hypothetical protein
VHPEEQGNLSEDQRRQIQQWAVGFNAERPNDGRLTVGIIENVGPIPISGAAARDVALDYFESKLPAARSRQHTGLSLMASSRSDVPDEWLTGVEYWEAVISWFRQATK